jgi:NAD(P)-dependent dehydrogenase (short-subunit alcohol dehydrogenase family)
LSFAWSSFCKALIGFTSAKLFAEAGASVVLADWNKDQVNKAAPQLSAGGYKTLVIACDVSDELQGKALVDKTVETFGRLDAAFA